MAKPTAADITKIVSLITKKPESVIKPTSTLRGDLEMDSLGALDLLVSIEEQYGIVIGQDQAANLKTIQDVLTYLDQLP